MKLPFRLFLALVLLSVFTGVYARNTIKIKSNVASSNVVAPGTRLVAGNPYQNEFYILDGHANHPTVVIPITKKHVISKAEVARIRLAISETLRDASTKHLKSHIKLASTKHHRRHAKHLVVVGKR